MYAQSVVAACSGCGKERGISTTSSAILSGVTEEPPNPIRRILGTWWGRLLAIATVLGVLADALNGTLDLSTRALGVFSGHKSVSTQDANLNRPLALTDTPVPGENDGRLGFGDSAGGRRVFPYVDYTPTATTPVFDSFVDAPYGTGDEREFMRVSASTTSPRYLQDYVRNANAHRSDTVWVRVIVDNNAVDTKNCDSPSGPTVADNTRLRTVVWDSPDGRRHVVRSWVEANNSTPAWVTDAIIVTTPEHNALTFDTHRSGVYARKPSTGLTPVSTQIFQSAGGLLGVAGKLGSCWDNREYVLLVFNLAKPH